MGMCRMTRVTTGRMIVGASVATHNGLIYLRDYACYHRTDETEDHGGLLPWVSLRTSESGMHVFQGAGW